VTFGTADATLYVANAVCGVLWTQSRSG